MQGLSEKDVQALSNEFGKTFSSPIHVIFLELIMGPTCSIFFEREPYIMKIPPRKKEAWLFTTSEFLMSIIQGFIITCSTLLLYLFVHE
jgi:P-type Ca2+ transporter type 2C